MHSFLLKHNFWFCSAFTLEHDMSQHDMSQCCTGLNGKRQQKQSESETNCQYDDLAVQPRVFMTCDDVHDLHVDTSARGQFKEE